MQARFSCEFYVHLIAITLHILDKKLTIFFAGKIKENYTRFSLKVDGDVVANLAKIVRK